MRRRWILLGLLLVGLAGLTAVLWPRGVNEKTYNRIQGGMTLQDVLGIAGVPETNNE